MVRHRMGWVLWIGLLCGGPALAQQDAGDAANEWRTMRAVLADGARDARLWQSVWAGGYGVATVYYGVRADRADDEDDRYDARVSAVKTALGVADVLLFPQPHARAERRLEALESEGRLDEARALMAEVAAEEQRRRGLRARLGPLLVNLAAGLTIAIDDDRPGDGALNFATGMLVSELRLRTQSQAVSNARPARQFTVRAGGGTLPVRYDWVLTPSMAAVALRF